MVGTIPLAALLSIFAADIVGRVFGMPFIEAASAVQQTGHCPPDCAMRSQRAHSWVEHGQEAGGRETPSAFRARSVIEALRPVPSCVSSTSAPRVSAYSDGNRIVPQHARVTGRQPAEQFDQRERDDG